MNNWMKMGMAGIALAGGLNALAQESSAENPSPDSQTIEVEKGGFKIEASDLIAKKLRDYVKPEPTETIA